MRRMKILTLVVIVGGLLTQVSCGTKKKGCGCGNDLNKVSTTRHYKR